ncbi:hypothetical protein BX616_002341, partial [Lobosporangium transversale]
IEPPRIAFYPDKVLDVIAEVPQSCNCNSNSNSNSSSNSNTVVLLPTSKESKNLTFQDLLLALSNFIQSSSSSLTVRNNEDFNSHFEEIKEMLLRAENRDDKMLQLHLEAREKSDRILELQLEAREKDDKMLAMQEEMKNLQEQTLNRLVMLQQKAEAILVQTFELHEYPIPRLFIILPADRSNWDPREVLKNKFRLHFLCECGDLSVEASKDSQNQSHIARHEGYEIRNSTEFFQKYGKHMVILLQCLKVRTPLSTPLAPVPDLKDCIDYSLDYLNELSKEYAALNNINTIDDYEPLEGADLRQLHKFLQTNGEDRKLGNLYRTKTEKGHIKWVRIDHHRSPYREKEQKALEKVVGMSQ